jgi:hypothetical protein
MVRGHGCPPGRLGGHLVPPATVILRIIGRNIAGLGRGLGPIQSVNRRCEGRGIPLSDKYRTHSCKAQHIRLPASSCTATSAAPARRVRVRRSYPRAPGEGLCRIPHLSFAEFTKDEARRSGPQAAGRITIIPDLVRMQALASVQQPCSTPSKSPAPLGTTSTQKHRDLQVFCDLEKPIVLPSQGRGRWFDRASPTSESPSKRGIPMFAGSFAGSAMIASVQQPVLVTCRETGLARATAP